MKTLKEAYLEIKKRYPDMGISAVLRCGEFCVFDLVPKGKKAVGSPYNPVIISKEEGKEYSIDILDSDDCPDLYSVNNEELEKIFSPEDYTLKEGYDAEIEIN